MSALDSLKEGGVRVRRWQNLTAGRSKGRTVGRRHEYVITSVRKKSITGLEGTGETARQRAVEHRRGGAGLAKCSASRRERCITINVILRELRYLLCMYDIFMADIFYSQSDFGEVALSENSSSLFLSRATEIDPVSIERPKMISPTVARTKWPSALYWWQKKNNFTHTLQKVFQFRPRLR